MKTQKNLLKQKISLYLKRGQLFKNEEYKKLETPFLTKARKNFTVANLLFQISEQKEMRKILSLSSDFEMYDWAIIVSYYAMYTSSLSALAKIGYKSKSHAATITILKYNFVKSKKLELKEISKLTKAYELSEHLITKLLQTKSKRETAQYDATPSITREMAKSALRDANEFITRIEDMLLIS